MINKNFIFSENWWKINTYPNDSFYLIVDLRKRKNPLKSVKKTTGRSISEWIFVKTFEKNVVSEGLILEWSYYKFKLANTL